MRPQGKKLNIKTLSRTVKMLFGFYPVLAPITCVCILFSAVASAIPGLFIQKVIESIQKWQSTGDWASAKPEIVSKVLILISLYVLSIIAITIHTQLMAYMTQGFLKKMRCAITQNFTENGMDRSITGLPVHSFQMPPISGPSISHAKRRNNRQNRTKNSCRNRNRKRKSSPPKKEPSPPLKTLWQAKMNRPPYSSTTFPQNWMSN